MKFGKIFRFELVYQLRRIPTWLYFVVVLAAAFASVRGNYLSDARNGDFLLGSPFVIAAVTVLCSLLWVLVAAAVAGDAATRDAHTRMDPLTYAAPVSRAEYLGGRFLAAFALNALILLAVPAGILLALYLPGVEPEVLGPFHPAALLTAYALIALPNAFVTTAIQFALAVLNRRAIASYLGSVLLFVTAYMVAGGVALLVGPALGKLLDPIGVVGVLSEMASTWTPVEKNTRLIAVEGPVLLNRLLWIGVAVAMLAFTHRRFRFAYPGARPARRRFGRRREVPAAPAAPSGIARSTPLSIPRVPRAFGFATHARQTRVIAWRSFRAIAKSRGGLVPLAVIAMLAGLYMLGHMEFMGVPLFPRTDHIVTWLTAPLTDPRTPWVIIPLLTIFYAGEAVWREREAGLSEIADAAPVPEWVLFLGRYLGLALVLVAWMAFLSAAGMLVQARMGYSHTQPAVYLRILFGLQLADYLLFALLALVAQVLASEKHIGYLVTLVAYGLITFASALGVQHNLLVYGADPGWSYTDMRGFGASLGPWLWFKLYWAAWALLLAVAATLLWARGRELGLAKRLRLARGRFTRPMMAWAGVAAGLIVGLGGFIFHNTNIRNEYHTAAERLERRAEYERRYGRYREAAQPWLTATTLRVEIYPERGEVELRGSYRLVNSGAVAIDSIHLATAPDAETGAISFDRPATRVLDDEELGHRIYALKSPLQPGDSLRLGFAVRVEPRGFGNGGAPSAVVANGTYFTNAEWLPAIGYQAARELGDAGERRARGLPPRRAIPSLYDVAARQHRTDAERIAFDAVVGTATGQTAVAPGALRGTWTRGGRRYFHYVANAPIVNEYALFSARYAVRQARWGGVSIQIFHHPEHAANLDRMIRGVRAALDYHAARFGPYPYSELRLVERPGHGFALHADAINIAYDEGFSLLNPAADPDAADLVFSVVAHEVAHQWWGTRLRPAYVEGSPLLIESLAQYSAMRVVEKDGGPEALNRLIHAMRAAYEIPRSRASVPLLRTTDGFLAYRKGPFALYALSEYVGAERMDEALRNLFQKHASVAPPLATTLDLYRELQAVTPDSLRPLLRDLFEANTFWSLQAERATARQTAAGAWTVTLDVRAGKVVVDSAGGETPAAMNDWVEIAVFAPAKAGGGAGEPLYREKHRIRAGRQTITVVVPRRPASAAIDPRRLLTGSEMGDSFATIKIENPGTSR